ncbi:hypothetical protein OAB94_01755 [Flavobacteriaceae bacterium]|nr:hypothetical protein [Flavobacteriaceae bacterium]
MMVYLAGECYGKKVFVQQKFKFNRLDSFYYLKKSKEGMEWVPHYDNHMLDSGAFTFIMTKKKQKVNIDLFTDEYINYINEVDHKLFFEMDVDSVYGYEKVKQLRHRIESKTGKQSIPVFHMKRGIDDWKAMCKDYDYISLGIAGKAVSWGDHEAFYKFVMSARNEGCKVHGLGITGMRTLAKVPFFSVDSSAWTAGNRYKTIFKFDGRYVKSVKTDLRNKRISNHLGLATHNFKQWVDFSKSMENKIII